MKLSKKTFSKLIQNWNKNNPQSLRDFFFDNILDNMHYDKDLQKLIPKMITSNQELVMPQLSNYLDDGDLPIAQSKPTTKDNYIGIEIECFADISKAEALMLAVHYGIEGWVDISDDGSIEADIGRDFEFRVLIKESTMKQQLAKLGKFLKAGEFEVNDSCGLHVHLDMRNRKMMEVYNRLVKFQDLMFGMVDRSRRNNDEYCAYVNKYNGNHRYVAINKSAYEKHRTIEVRLHQGTVDVKLISNWVNLLLKIINSTNAAPKSMKKKDAVIKWLGKNRGLKSYVKKTYEPDWKDNLYDDDFNEDEDVLW